MIYTVEGLVTEESTGFDDVDEPDSCTGSATGAESTIFGCCCSCCNVDVVVPALSGAEVMVGFGSGTLLVATPLFGGTTGCCCWNPLKRDI